MANNKPWTCQELVDHADNWSLAGNVGLLKHMEQFSENLFQKAEETDKNLNNLLHDLDSTSIQLDLVKNQFLGLQNTQFIESRVYEDDETVSEEPVEPKEHKLDDDEKRKMVKQAVLDGLNVLDKYYDRVSIPGSDSEADEPDFTNYVLREKDPYINRPLPYVIGTEEWHTKWHAGLEDSSDEDDDEPNGRKTENIEDEFSDTDSESNLPIADRRIYDDTGSHLDNDIINNYDEINGNSISAKTPIGNSTFAEQLAAKLGDVLTSSTGEGLDPEINTRPIQRRPQQNNSTSLFAQDLPPLLPTEEDTPKVGAEGLFSGGSGLFDDDDDDDLDDVQRPPPIAHSAKPKVPNLFDDDEEEEEDEKFVRLPEPRDKSKKLPRGLFDETDEDEEDREDLFAPNGHSTMTQAPPDLKKKAPAGGVNVLAGFLPKRQSSSSEEEDSGDIAQPPPPLPKVEAAPRKTMSPIKTVEPSREVPKLETSKPPLQKRVLSLFDDTDDLFEDDLFSESATKSTPVKNVKDTVKGLFDDDKTQIDPPPIFGSKSVSEKPLIKSRNLFDESSEDEEDMFASPITEKLQKSLFDDLGGVTETKKEGLGPKPKIPEKKTGKVASDYANVTVPLAEEQKGNVAEMSQKSIFDDLGGISKDKMEGLGPKPEIPEKKIGKPTADSENITIPVAAEQKVKPEVPFRLFENQPPSLLDEDDWDTKSDKSSNSENESENVPEVPPPIDILGSPQKRKSPEPEVEVPNDAITSPEKKIPGKLKHNLNINVGALMPGAKMAKPKLEPSIPEPTEITVPEKLSPISLPEGSPVISETAPQEGESVVQVLQSVTKNRAKIAIKRRPSTRQGRKAALAKSTSSEDLEEPKGETPEDPPCLPTAEFHETLGKMTKDQGVDIFDDTPKTEKNVSIFDDFDIDKNLERQSDFKQSQVDQHGTPSRRKLIIDEEDSEDPMIQLPPPLEVTQNKERTQVKKISLFDDLDDFDQNDDDLFASNDLFSAKKPNPRIGDVSNVRVFGNDDLEDSDMKPPPLEKDIFDDQFEEPVVSDKTVSEFKAKGGLFDNSPMDQDYDDLFADPSFTSKTQNPSNENTIPKISGNTTTSKSFFDEDSEIPADDLFGGNKSSRNSAVAKPNKNVNTSLFGDDDDDDLFGGSSSKTAPSNSGRSKTFGKPGKSLFGDDDDDNDDIFGSNKRRSNASASVPKRVAHSAKTEKPSGSGAGVKKASTTRPMNDPLAALLGDDDD